MSNTETSEEPLIINGVNVSEYTEEDLLGADEVDSMIAEEQQS